MNILLSEKKFGQLLCYMIVGGACIATWTANSEIAYSLMFVLDGLLVLHMLFNYTKPRKGIIFLLIVFLYFLTRSIHGLNIFASINVSKTILLWVTVYAGVVIYFDRNEFCGIVKNVPWLLIPHTLLVFVQYVEGYGVDHIGGLYGTYMGISNGGNHVFILICSCILIVLMVNKDISYKLFALGILACVVCAGVAEIKYYFFEMIVLTLIYSVFTKSLKKSIVAMVVVAILVGAGVKIVTMINPFFEEFFSLEGIEAYLAASAIGNGGVLYITRTNGYIYISSLLFNGDPISILFGKGFGSELSGISNSLHGAWFSYTVIFLAGGVVGTLLIFLLVSSFIRSGFRCMNTFEGKLIFCVAAMVVCAFFYDSQFVSPYTSPLYFFMLAGSEVMRTKEVNNGQNI